MWQWCYWYGSPAVEAYTQQKANSGFMSYEKAVQNNYHTLPASLQAKLDKGKKLKGSEEQTVKGFACLETELAKKPEERIPDKFTEDHENILNLDDEISLPAEDDESGFDDDDDDAALESDDAVHKARKTPIKKKTTAKTKKSTAKKDTKPPAKKQKKPSSPEAEVDAVGEAELSGESDEDLSDDEKVSEEDDEKDDDFDKDPIEDDDNDEDLNYHEEEVGKKKKKKGAAKKRLSVESDARPKKATKKAAAKKVVEPKEPRDPDAEAKLLIRRERDQLRVRGNREAKAYEACVELFKVVVDELGEAMDKKDTVKVVRCMKTLKKDVNALTAPFIEEFKLAHLMKAAKAVLTSDEGKNVRKELWGEMKVVYEEKKGNVPEGWRIRLSSKESKEEPKKEKPRKPEIQKKRPERKEGSMSQDVKSGGDDKGRDLDTKDAKSQPGLDTSRLSTSRQGGDDMAVDVVPKKPGFKRGESPKPRLVASTSQPPLKVKTESSTALPSMKPPKKKNSLSSWKTLMNTDSKPKEKSDTPKARRSLTPSDESILAKKVPEWLTKERPEDPAVQTSEDRQLGLEFFDEAAEYFPDTINCPSFARALEGGLFAWATHAWATKDTLEESLEMTYWSKLHNIVGAIGGKHKTGTLVAAIMAGTYGSAEEIMKLPDEVLMESFENKSDGSY